MKIQAIRISGFRGIPPLDPEGIELNFLDNLSVPQNLVLFGPNAYGKSSIADALEWLFKEQARGSHYFEAYSQVDNVHLNLGKPGYRATAFVELVLLHHGVVYTVRKELDQTGNKVAESFAGLETEFRQAQDEIVILDHDQFREFVSAASKEKWATFSGLIGYEDLDSFRSGMDSLTGKSLTDSLRFSELETQVRAKRQELSRHLIEELRRYNIESSQPSRGDLETGFLARLEVTLASLGMSVPGTLDSVTDDLFAEIRSQINPSTAVVHAADRISLLKQQSLVLQPLGTAFESELDALVSTAADLDLKKASFDKQLLAEFYEKGIQVIAERKALPDECPFCGQPSEWLGLQQLVSERMKALDVNAVMRLHSGLATNWRRVRSQLTDKGQALASVELPSVRQAYDDIPAPELVDSAINLHSFDLEFIRNWSEKCRAFMFRVEFARREVESQRLSTETALSINASGQLRDQVDDLYRMWSGIRDLVRAEQELTALDRKVKTTNEVIDALREIARRFREELNDFSARVIDLINEDVRRYYDALHPNDGVRPYLRASIAGNQRSVTLKCDYLGTTDRDAASILSESHRNSLGLAILLAFMKYKRRTGSPVEFLVLDDVTQSFDVGHRLSLIKFLEDPTFPEISDGQVLFLTHDRTLADLIRRAGDQDRQGWLRYDIRTWQLNAMLIEPHKVDLLQRAKALLNQGDELAAAIYGRHALEEVCRKVVQTASLRMYYEPAPWKITVDKFQEAIMSEVRSLWEQSIQRGAATVPLGLIDPDAVGLAELDRALRVLHYTVHDSVFLESPPALSEIRIAIGAVERFRDLFTCPHCRAQRSPKISYFPRLSRDRQGNPIKCRLCNQPLIAP